MFKWLNKQGVESDRGFAVQIVDRFTIVYREGENVITVPVEFAYLSGSSTVSIDPHAFGKWDGDPSKITIPLEKQQEIYENFRQALNFQKLTVVVEEPES